MGVIGADVDDDAAGLSVEHAPVASIKGREILEHSEVGEEEESTRDENEIELQVGNVEDMASWTGHPHVKGSSESMRMALLTLSSVGLQCVATKQS
jgi:hypothetical protein